METPAEVVSRTREAFNLGATRDVKRRITSLKNFLRFVRENEEAIVGAMYEDLRKHREEARMEVALATNHVSYLLDNARMWAKPEKPTKRWVDLLDGVYVHHDPYGVVLVMGAWNVPLLTLLPVAGAIAAGNCVVIKPSHNSPSFGNLLAQKLPKYLDPACYPVVVGDIAQTTQLLSERFDYIYYTGSVAVGKIVHQAANRFLTPTTLELGGKNPVYIDPSADLELTANRVIWGKCFNSGQACISPDYVLCSKSVEEEFLKHASTALEKFYGNNPKSCPIVNSNHFRRLSGLLEGLNIVIGGLCDPIENYIDPTVAVDVGSDHPIMQEEIFGPILPIITVNSPEQAVDFINSREKALALYIFGENSSVRDYIIDNTSSGGVVVNDTLMQLIVQNLPFGGVGLSGHGLYKAKYSFDTFVHKKSVLVKNTWRMMEKFNRFRYPPYCARNVDFLAFLTKYRRGPSWGCVVYLGIFAIGLVIGFCVVYFSKLIAHRCNGDETN